MSVDFFELPLPIRVYGANRDTLLKIDNTVNDEIFSVTLPFEVDSISFNDDLWLMASSQSTVIKGLVTSIEDEIAGTSLFSLFPNPSNKELNISMNVPMDDAHYTISDLTGRLVNRGTLNDKNEIIDISELPPSMYIFSMYNGHEKTALRFLKK